MCGDQAPLIGSAGVSWAGDKAPCAHGAVLPVGDKVLPVTPGVGLVWVSWAVLAALHRPCPGMRVWKGHGSEDMDLFGDTRVPLLLRVRPPIRPSVCVCSGATV